MSEYITEWVSHNIEDSFVREEIVRCRDCREYNTELYSHISCELLARYVEPYGYCAWGERRERTCHIEHPYYKDAPIINGQPRCSECKTELAVGTFPNYCPNCGAKVIESS